MARGVASLLLMLSLEAATLLLLVVVSAAAVPYGMDAIRLPTHNVRDLVTGMGTATNGGAIGEERPWACCDRTMCMTRTRPITCWCLDIVDRCSSACKQCEKTNDSRHFCADQYKGWPGPQCNRKDASRSHYYGGLTADERRQEEEATAAMVADQEEKN